MIEVVAAPSQSFRRRTIEMGQELATTRLDPVQPDTGDRCMAVEAYARLHFVSSTSQTHRSAHTEGVQLCTLSVVVVFHGIIHRMIILRGTIPLSRCNWSRCLHELWLEQIVLLSRRPLPVRTLCCIMAFVHTECVRIESGLASRHHWRCRSPVSGVQCGNGVTNATNATKTCGEGRKSCELGQTGKLWKGKERLYASLTRPDEHATPQAARTTRASVLVGAIDTMGASPSYCSRLYEVAHLRAFANYVLSFSAATLRCAQALFGTSQ